MRHRLAVIFAVASIASAPAGAWDHGRPGLWTMTVQMDGMPAMPALTPEQKAMLAQRGISVPGGGTSGAMTHEVCITPEQAARNTPPDTGRQGCRVDSLKHDGKTWDADLVCEQRAMRGAHTHVVYDSDETYHGDMKLITEMPGQGVTERVTHFKGQWKGADCGDVKPHESPK